MQKVIIQMGVTAITTSVIEHVLGSTGRIDMATWVKVAGTSVLGITALSQVKTIFETLGAF